MEEPADLGHVDGMAMFIDENVLVINRYAEPLRSQVLAEIHGTFDNIQVIEIERAVDQSLGVDEHFSSVYGIYVNALVTNRFIYLPVFGEAMDQQVIHEIQNHTTKQVVPILSQAIFVVCLANYPEIMRESLLK